MADLLVIDLEMCKVDRNVTKGSGVYLDHEIIEIGACILGKKNKIRDEWKSYVRPQHGSLDSYISELTGIKDIDLSMAPVLADALKKMANWINGRELTAVSWSDTDEIQLSIEMEQKGIKNEVIEKLLTDWADIQKSYDRLTKATRSTSLENAMRAEGVRPDGRLHDGADDARNTALLIAKLFEEGKELEMEPINQTFEYHDDANDEFNVSPFAGLFKF
ncbi:MAG: exonuclease domain-containing protein [Lachnospiraceae bacterium]|nr:exonuclease domain-containing protein [Lachnospiraceae bacterium]